MKNEIIKAAKDIEHGKIDLNTARNLLFGFFDVSVSDLSNFEFQRLFEWLQEPKREPAQTKFTSGMTRNIAREIEYLLK